MPDETPAAVPSAYPSHPEEMKAVFDLKIGKFVALQGSARWTPAGVVTAGITASAILLALAALVRARNARPR